MIEYAPIPKTVFTAEEALEYLGLPSRKALQRLCDGKRLAPMKYTKENRFHKDELDRFLDAEVESERTLRDIEP